MPVLVFLFLFVFCGCNGKNGIIVTNLKCEYQTNPLSIGVSTPRLSWNTESGERGKMQSAYRVLVSEDPRKLEKNTGDVWDSKKVRSDQSVFVSYSGKRLISGKQYFWKVRAWDEDGKASDWSRTNTWTMGFLTGKDWNAKWVGTGNNTEKDSVTQHAALQFRKEFVIEKKPVKAIARFSGLGFGELYINGEKISNDKMAPAWTDFRKKVYYMSYDVTPQITEGSNAVGVMLGNGWLNLPTPDLFAYEKAPWKSDPRFMLNITVTYHDGTISTVVSDETWKWRVSEIIFNCVRGGESVDAMRIQEGWNNTSFNDNEWHTSSVVTPPSGRLVPQALPSEQITKFIKPVSLTEPRPGVFIYDLGEHIAGWAKFKTSGDEGQKVELVFDENLNQDGTINRRSLSGHTWGRYQTGELILSGRGVDLFEPAFTYHGFRYVQVKGLTSKPALEDLVGCMVHNNLVDAGDFECSNELLNKIHEAAKHSLLNTLHGVLTEPAREKINWTQDAHNAVEVGIYNYDFYSFVTKWMEDVIESQEPNGHVPPINPTANWGFTKPGGMPPDWSDPWWGGVILEIPWFIYNYYGDMQALARSYNPMKRYVDFLGTTTVDSVFLDWWLGDWLEVGGTGGRSKRSPIIQVSTAGYYYYATLLSKVANILGKKKDSDEYGKLSEKIKLAYNKRFLDHETGLYADDSQTCQVMPLYLGLAQDDKRKLITRRLLDNIEKWNGHLNSGFVGYLYLLYGLTDLGYADTAYRMVNTEEYPGWGYMVKHGNTLWESWKGNAFNFISLGGVDAWFYSALAGITPDEENPGFKKIVIKPHIPGDLQWVNAVHYSQYGRIGSAWKIMNDTLVMDIEVPVNTTAQVCIPCENPDKISESGKPVRQVKSIRVTETEADRTIVEIGSGKYQFVIPF